MPFQRSFVADQLSLEHGAERLRHGLIVRLTFTANRVHSTSVGQAFDVADCKVLNTPIRVTDQLLGSPPWQVRDQMPISMQSNAGWVRSEVETCQPPSRRFEPPSRLRQLLGLGLGQLGEPHTQSVFLPLTAGITSSR